MANKLSGQSRFNAATRKLFLAHLAETANVAASERVAGMVARSAYEERRRSPAFFAAWEVALAEGYARLEASLLSVALIKPSAKTDEALQKARAQSNRLGINLLNWHRANVKAAAPSTQRVTREDLPALKLQLTLTLAKMRERVGIPLEGLPDAIGQDNASPPDQGAAR
jgi:hypothetical protein